jgi:hypothetical protein
MHNWIQIARTQFGSIDICGNGRYAVVQMLSGKPRAAYLLDDEERAYRALLGYDDGKVVDLQPRKPCPVPTIKDDYEDLLWEKRQSRA